MRYKHEYFSSLVLSYQFLNWLWLEVIWTAEEKLDSGNACQYI